MTNPLLRIFVGWDSKEPIAFSVLTHSILARASIPISIIPLTLQSVGHTYTRKRGPMEATEFSMTRFLVPFLSNYEGHSVFMDCDMLCQVDIAELWLYILTNSDKAVLCCQHDYVPKGAEKFEGHIQTAYPRKNWSSMMVFNNALCRQLTPEKVNTQSGMWLHRFSWLDEHSNMTDDGRACMCDSLNSIGALPLEWNWLVGEYEPKLDAKILHYTLGGPWHGSERDWFSAAEGDLWHDELTKMYGTRAHSYEVHR